MSPMLRKLLGAQVPLPALAVSLALNAALATGLVLVDADRDVQRARVAEVQAVATAQTEMAQAIADAANWRAEASERAAQAAREAGAADRAAARRYLNLPVPPPAERCEAAQALVDEALRESRQ